MASRVAVAIAVLMAAGIARAGESLRFESVDGAPLEVRAAPEQRVVLHFWATWCPSCKEELGALDRAAAACDPARVRVVAVDVGEDANTVRRWLDERPLAIAVAIDTDGETWRRSGGREMPANWIWDGAKWRWRLGPASETAWRERLASLGCGR
jgi:thiol-disulfide isomerase/thioredoxin